MLLVLPVHQHLLVVLDKDLNETDTVQMLVKKKTHLMEFVPYMRPYLSALMCRYHLYIEKNMEKSSILHDNIHLRDLKPDFCTNVPLV